MKTLFVTVGSTKFDSLIEALCSEQFEAAALQQNICRWIVQYGKSDPSRLSNVSKQVEIIKFEYSSSLEPHFSTADVIIAHGGSGTILDSIRGPVFSNSGGFPKRLIVVPNSCLLDNHQSELARELAKSGICMNVELHDLSLALSAHWEGSGALTVPETLLLDKLIM